MWVPIPGTVAVIVVPPRPVHKCQREGAIMHGESRRRRAGGANLSRKRDASP